MTDKSVREFYRLSLIADQGERKNPRRCALVQDLRERYGDEILFPHVDKKKISFTHRSTGMRFEWKTPAHIVRWIEKFDGGDAPEDSGVGLRLADAKIKTRESRKPVTPKSKAPADDPRRKPRRKAAYR